MKKEKSRNTLSDTRRGEDCRKKKGKTFYEKELYKKLPLESAT